MQNGRKITLNVTPDAGIGAADTLCVPEEAWAAYEGALASSVTLTVIWVFILYQIWLGACWILRWEMKHFLGIWQFATDTTTKFVP